MLDNLVEEIHENAVVHGFYQDEKRILDMAAIYTEFYDEDIEVIRDLFITQKIGLIMSELGEAMEAHRHNIKSDSYVDWEGLLSIKDDDMFKKTFEDFVKDSFGDELADTIIRILDLVGHLDIPIDKHLQAKMRYNSLREHKHGGKY